MHYRARPIAPVLLMPAKLCDLQTGATWSDVWNAYICQRTEIKRVNGNLSKITNEAQQP